ncbi:MAG: valine--tRNA ligase, partial [Actinobacteria bacterium]|nr:valine--tRNA ligase [Actinomycetota bacterium]
EAKVSMRTPILVATLQVPAALADGVRLALGDVRAAGRLTGDLAVVVAEVDAPVAVDAVLEQASA